MIQEDVGLQSNVSMPNEGLVERRFVIEQYVRYDAPKKNRAIPANMDEWDWSSADDLDRRLKASGFKHGIISGYAFWKTVAPSRSDLADCAVEAKIFPHLPRPLGQSDGTPEFEQWKPDRNTEWFEPLERGEEYPTDWPLIIRPAVLREYPAKYYVEDGSGRAVCFFRRLVRTSNYTSRAYGHLGMIPDKTSTFIRKTFPELLSK
jgi:hypothetical protein